MAAIHLEIKEADGPLEDIGFKWEVQPFVDGASIDEPYLEKRSKKKIVREYKKKYSKVYVNGVLVE